VTTFVLYREPPDGLLLRQRHPRAFACLLLALLDGPELGPFFVHKILLADAFSDLSAFASIFFSCNANFSGNISIGNQSSKSELKLAIGDVLILGFEIP